MKVRMKFTTKLLPADAVRKIVTMQDHTVPFTVIVQDGAYVRAHTMLGPITIDDNMIIGPLTTRDTHVRGTIEKTGPILTGMLSFAAIQTPTRTVIGWEHDLTFVPAPILNGVLAVVMWVGYGVGIRRLIMRKS